VRIPLSWLREFVEVKLGLDELADVLTFGGFEVEDIHRPTAGTRGVVVAEVIDVAAVEGSDKLSLVHVTDGVETHEIICGASNYAPGDRVPAALPGAVLPGGFEIGRKKVFGHVSNGMLASARELGVTDDHRGIWILEADAPLGAALDEWLELDDPVIEVAILPDRAYGLAILGIARDVAALTGAELKLPAATTATRIGGDTGVPVTIVDPTACSRFDARRIDGVRIAPSPAWVQKRLAACGVRPISNVVDATNYAMLEVGHPVHAYDLATLQGPRIDVRRAAPGETLVTLDGVERTLHPEDLVIADAAGAVGLAGVMGGGRTEVSDATSSLLVEVASFEPVTIARAARRHKLFSEASTRFERTVPPESVPLGATRASELIVRMAGGKIVAAADNYPSPVVRESIHLRPARARARLGMPIDDSSQQVLLESIDCAVELVADGLLVTPPAYRPDMREEADLLEELARLHGYEKLPETMPTSGQVGARSPAHEARRAVRRALAGGGWSEVLAFPFIADREIEALGLAADDPRRHTVPLVNPLSAEESVLRTTLLPGILRIVRHNTNRQTPDVAVFEIGHVFLRPTAQRPGASGGPEDTLLPAEPLSLAFAAAGSAVARRHDRPARVADLYDLLGAADLVRSALGLPAFVVEPFSESPFHPGRAARLLCDGEAVGVVGELHPRVIEALDLPARTLVGELDLGQLIGEGIRPARGKTPSNLPGVRFDVAVVVAQDIAAAAVRDVVAQAAGDKLTALALFDVFQGEQLGEGLKSLAYTVKLDDAERQLTSEDEAAAIAAIEAAVAKRLGGRMRR